MRSVVELAAGMLTGSTYHRRARSPRRPNSVPRARRLVFAMIGAALALSLGASPAGAAPPAPTLLIEGAGDGHGVGMSQYGALGLAEHGYSDTQILAHYYSSTSIGLAPAGHVVRVLVGSKVQDIPLERYVRGVVAAEMPSSWPAAALEAQAIASRTYALTSDAGGSRFDVYSDTRSQVYLGAAAETPATNAAVRATEGQVVTYEGRPATTYFFASSGGMTENIENAFFGAAPAPWLRGVSDPYETSASAWQRSMSMSEASSRLEGLVQGSLLGIEVLTRGVSPRIVSAEVLGTRGNTPVNGAELEYRLSLPSTWAYFSLRSGASVTREPDLSGHQAPGSAPASSAASHHHSSHPSRSSSHSRHTSKRSSRTSKRSSRHARGGSSKHAQSLLTFDRASGGTVAPGGAPGAGSATAGAPLGTFAGGADGSPAGTGGAAAG